MSDAGLFELPQKYLDLQAEARALAAACADVAARADEADSPTSASGWRTPG
jgi:hypothetical protein